MNSQERIAAARYAAAYDAVGASLQEAQDRADQLEAAAAVLAAVRTQLQNPCLSAAHKKLILGETLKQWPQAAQFIQVLIEAKRLHLLMEICDRVKMLLDDRKGISRAIVTSARVLNQAQEQATKRALSTRYGKIVEATFRTDPSLLGGIIAQCGGELLDGSLKTRLKKLQEEIAK